MECNWLNFNDEIGLCREYKKKEDADMERDKY